MGRPPQSSRTRTSRCRLPRPARRVLRRDNAAALPMPATAQLRRRSVGTASARAPASSSTASAACGRRFWRMLRSLGSTARRSSTAASTSGRPRRPTEAVLPKAAPEFVAKPRQGLFVGRGCRCARRWEHRHRQCAWTAVSQGLEPAARQARAHPRQRHARPRAREPRDKSLHHAR